MAHQQTSDSWQFHEYADVHDVPHFFSGVILVKYERNVTFWESWYGGFTDFYSSSLSFASVRTEEFVQLEPLHWPQAGEHSRLCLRQEHRIVLHPDAQLHLTICSRLSGAGGISVITGITCPSLTYLPALLFNIHVIPFPLQDLGVHPVTVVFRCSRCGWEVVMLNMGCSCCQFFFVALIPDIIELASWLSVIEDH